MAKILESNNFGRFILSLFNRNIKKTWDLEASMQKYGFRDATPIEVKRLENGYLEIQDGHHRFVVARKLGIPVKYIEVTDDMTMAEREQTTHKWGVVDFLDGRVRQGIQAYIAVKEYHLRTGIGIGACISMLAGDSAGSGNWSKKFKNGTYRLGDTTQAEIVGKLALHCKEKGFEYWKHPLFIQALSKIVWAESFIPEVLMNKITTFSEYLKKQPLKNDYVNMLDSIYNRQSQDRVPLAFEAEQAARKRNICQKKAVRRSKPSLTI
jgi:hypothetical protein